MQKFPSLDPVFEQRQHLSHKVIPVIDLFAGPGGLSEGFSRQSENSIVFETRLAIEKDPIAAKTLTLRSFFRQFKVENVPEEYYRAIRQELPLSALERFSEWKQASKKVWNAELGAISDIELHERIKNALGGARDWVLLGGPPCQAYSLMGRARMTGIGAAAREANTDIEGIRTRKQKSFDLDLRHQLYREYLRIVAIHQPSIFVMENVKGILSSTLPGPKGSPRPRVFDQIRSDLSDPWSALSKDPHLDSLKRFRGSGSYRYKLFSFAVPGAGLQDRDFLVRSEEYGLPQKRHRVIILGIREDIDQIPGALSRSASVSVRDAIGMLPPLRSGLSKGQDDAAIWHRTIRQNLTTMGAFSKNFPKKSLDEALGPEAHSWTRGLKFLPKRPTKPRSRLDRWFYDDRLNGIIQHQSRSHMPTDLVRYLFVSATAMQNGRSPKLAEWPPTLLPLHRNIDINGQTGIATATGFADRFKVQIWDEASSTITSHISKDGHYYIHPDPSQCRSLTVREAARLQTFPDNYFFCGNRTQQYHQIGNAVPPYLALQLAGVVAKLITADSREVKSGDRRPQSKDAQFQYVANTIGRHKA